MIAMDHQAVMRDVAEVFEPFNLPKHSIDGLVENLASSEHLTDFIMQFQHCEIEPASSRAATSAATIALAYFLGGLLPLLPYIFVGKNEVYKGLYVSVGVMVVALFVFGYIKTCIVKGWSKGRNVSDGCAGGLQMVVVGGCCAMAAMGLVKLFNSGEGGN